MTYLWRYNRITGYWVAMRSCTENTASMWLSVFQTDEPNEHFKLSQRQPIKAPK